LDSLVGKFRSLGTAKKKTCDRLRYPRKEILDIQGKLQLHETHLSAYLQTLGISSLGRVESQAEENVEKIPRALDRWGAELRSGQHPGSTFSDHTDDEKEYWRTLRRRLVGEGFNSKVMASNETAILERIHEMKTFGLLESDAPDTSDDDYWTDAPPVRGTYKVPEVISDAESDTEHEITPKQSMSSLRKPTSLKTDGASIPLRISRPYSIIAGEGKGEKSTLSVDDLPPTLLLGQALTLGHQPRAQLVYLQVTPQAYRQSQKHPTERLNDFQHKMHLQMTHLKCDLPIIFRQTQQPAA
jgi:hypothetical protein